MTSFSTLCESARSSLKENWGRAILTLLLTAGVAGLFAVTHQIAFSLLPPSGLSVLPAVFALLDLLVVVPVYFGVLYWFWSLSGGARPALSGMFVFFDHFEGYARIVWYYISLSLRALCWAVVFYAGPVSALAASVWFVRQRW